MKVHANPLWHIKAIGGCLHHQSPAEASVNNLVARRMVKKQQMRWSEQGANLLLQVRVVVANGDLEDRLAYQPPVQPSGHHLAFRTSAALPNRRMIPEN